MLFQLLKPKRNKDTEVRHEEIEFKVALYYLK